MKDSKTPPHILPVIVIAQFAGTALWFAGNAIMPELQALYDLPETALGWMTALVQLGFICGTLIFAFFLLADRFSPSRVFMVSAILGGLLNLLMLVDQAGLWSLLIIRFMTGIFLAGIYPIGMKIAADWFSGGLGKALGFLVGALVLGTAFPHLIRAGTGSFGIAPVVIGTSLAAIAGGLIIGFGVPDGPFRKKGARFNPRIIKQIFQNKPFRAAAFGYFGHMWELYAFWAFVPIFIELYLGQVYTASVSMWSFLVIATGALGCILGGYWSMKIGSARIAFGMLLLSGLFCLCSPLIWELKPLLFLPLLMIWGFSVVGDSPQFSTLVAKTAPQLYVGSALTIVNGIGFTVTIFSIQLLGYLQFVLPPQYLFLPLLVGPLLGLKAVSSLLSTNNQRKNS